MVPRSDFGQVRSTNKHLFYFERLSTRGSSTSNCLVRMSEHRHAPPIVLSAMKENARVLGQGDFKHLYRYDYSFWRS